MQGDDPSLSGPWRDMVWYEQMINRGIAEADQRRSAIDHVTARRMALWLLPHSREEPEFMRGLIHFARTGGITQDLKKNLQHRARSAAHPNRLHATRLLQYVVARRRDLGRIGDHFGAVCDQIDRADLLLEDLRNRVLENRIHPERATGDWREKLPLQPIAMARRDDVTRAVTLILDANVAEAVIHAVTADVMEREARIRHIRQESQTLFPASYGWRNREAIVARETQITSGLRSVERAYRAVLEPTPAPEFKQILPAGNRASDYEPEME